MDTELHRDAEPGVDLSDLPKAEEVAPALVEVIAAPRETFTRVELQKFLPVGAGS
jgi:hypothetical protein